MALVGFTAAPKVGPDLKWQSPTFLAPGKDFVEDSFSMDRVGEQGWFPDNSSVLHSSSPPIVPPGSSQSWTSTCPRLGTSGLQGLLSNRVECVPSAPNW